MKKAFELIKLKEIELGKEKILEFPAFLKKNCGIALAEVIESKPHYHKKTIEYYALVKGKCNAFINGKKIVLKPGNLLKINPLNIHYIKNKAPCNIVVLSKPSWKQEDHFSV